MAPPLLWKYRPKKAKLDYAWKKDSMGNPSDVRGSNGEPTQLELLLVDIVKAEATIPGRTEAGRAEVAATSAMLSRLEQDLGLMTKEEQAASYKHGLNLGINNVYIEC